MTAERYDYTEKRRAHWDSIALEMDGGAGWGKFYHQRVTRILQTLVLPGQRIIELGCAYGDLLAALEPSVGVGVDFSAEMIRFASARHSELQFVHADAQELDIKEAFDVIILSDLVNDLWDVQQVFQIAASLAEPHTRLIINAYSRLWELPLAVTERLNLARPNLYQNWLTVEDITNLLKLTDFQVIRHWSEILCPLNVPILQSFLNRFVVKLWPFRLGGLSNFVVARPLPREDPVTEKPLVSVIVPARNEAGNIDQIFERVPEMGRGTELVFVEGHSADNTYEAIERAVNSNSKRKCKLLKQSGSGKGDAVRLGFAQAEGEILMILDADLTVPPEDLPRFYEALVSGKGEFINGVRLVYPMEDQAMRFFNLLGNKLFSLGFSWTLGQPIKDTLCGTKVLWKEQYEIIAANRSYFGHLDPFGDFDLIFGAARLNLHILDLPIRYRERRYGTTNIQRWRHGLLLLRMAFVSALRLKFV
ncbi:MAG: glycosyltransferase [Desulfomonilaceae bacterium]